MVDKEKLVEDEKKIKQMVNDFNEKLIKEVNGRPYLLVLATLYEIERQGNNSKVAGQWNWRSNLYDKEDGRRKEDVEAGMKMMKLLVDQLDDAVVRKEIGIKSRYRLD